MDKAMKYKVCREISSEAFERGGVAEEKQRVNTGFGRAL